MPVLLSLSPQERLCTDELQNNNEKEMNAKEQFHFCVSSEATTLFTFLFECNLLLLF